MSPQHSPFLQTHGAIRLTKIAMVGSIALLMLLVASGNTFDYASNYQFVEHVLRMDTTFPGNELLYRSIHEPWAYHLAYCSIILAEYAAGLLCLCGVIQMLRALRSDSTHFHQSKIWALYGLCLGILIWFLGFQVIGGEWFGMWMSTQWNGLGSADRIVTFITLSLIFVSLRD